MRISAFQASILLGCRNQGRRASRLPLAVIFRAVGAVIRVLHVLGRSRGVEEVVRVKSVRSEIRRRLVSGLKR